MKYNNHHILHTPIHANIWNLKTCKPLNSRASLGYMVDVDFTWNKFFISFTSLEKKVCQIDIVSFLLVANTTVTKCSLMQTTNQHVHSEGDWEHELYHSMEGERGALDTAFFLCWQACNISVNIQQYTSKKTYPKHPQTNIFPFQTNPETPGHKEKKRFWTPWPRANPPKMKNHHLNLLPFQLCAITKGIARSSAYSKTINDMQLIYKVIVINEVRTRIHGQKL